MSAHLPPDNDLPDHIPSYDPQQEQLEKDRAANFRALSKISVGNRFRMLAGLPLLPETTKEIDTSITHDYTHFMRNIELSDLVGEYILTGVREEQGYERSDHYTKCSFTLDGVTYQADEDPSDGYRSYCSTVVATDLPAIQNYEVPVICTHSSEGEDILTIKNNESGETILRIGTDYTDHYYPRYVCDYTAP